MHHFLFLLALLQHSCAQDATTVSPFIVLGPPASASASSTPSLPTLASPTSSTVTVLGDPVSAALSSTMSIDKITTASSQSLSAVFTSTLSNVTTLSTVTINSFTTGKTSGILVSSTPAGISASPPPSPTSTGSSSSPMSSIALASQTPSGSSASTTPQMKEGVEISAGVLGFALLGVLIYFLVRFLKKRRMRKTAEPDKKSQTMKLQPFGRPPGYEFSTPYPSGLGHETMPYFATTFEPDHAKPMQAQELWNTGFVPAIGYEKGRISGRYELDTDGAGR